MTPELEKEIRDRVEAYKARGGKLRRGDIATCLIGAIGGHKAAQDLMGTEQSIAIECGFENFDAGKSARMHMDFYLFGMKIAKENGL